ncbi:MAG TPA: DUF2141 domain-containing protein [Saprospiraceae bacterium]|nr:DUF2141 domain-containing protein [Saprospiraceae bacterium]
MLYSCKLYGIRVRPKHAIAMKSNIIFLPAIMLYCHLNLFSQQFTVIIQAEGVKDHDGKLIVAVFSSQTDFDNEKTCYEEEFEKTALQNGKLTFQIDLPPGIYGITILDDEDGDKKMKYNALGIPREGFGIVNLETTGLRKPKFSDFCFNLSKNQGRRKVKMRYIF